MPGKKNYIFSLLVNDIYIYYFSWKKYFTRGRINDLIIIFYKSIWLTCLFATFEFLPVANVITWQSTGLPSNDKLSSGISRQIIHSMWARGRGSGRKNINAMSWRSVMLKQQHNMNWRPFLTQTIKCLAYSKKHNRKLNWAFKNTFLHIKANIT